ncbi:dodecin [Brachybacterium fresconis]|uniref:Flavin-binding protein dodecin n=1 Tax=Brachybacterium fresconis TaxID=173363 RepID=A0ABS4YJ16_9MICO|nr:dodecin [Brachybacterium fresconis]MBP2408417.1 flavin-binding protein dodecin [Brachybacterium fresconis]
MAGHVYNITEIVGTSPESSDAAVANAVAEASKSLRNLDWFEVQSIRGRLEDGAVAHWQVAIKVGFRHEG